MKCIGCDTPIPPGGTKCPMCGAPVKVDPPSLPLQTMQTPVQIYTPTQNSDGVECPNCHAKNAIYANNKGFGLGNAAVGAFLLGPIGLLGGMIGSKEIKITCLACNYSWLPGQTKTFLDLDNTAKFSFKRVFLSVLVAGTLMLIILYLIREKLR